MRSGFVLLCAAALLSGCSGDKTKTAVKSDTVMISADKARLDALDRPIGRVTRLASVNSNITVNGQPRLAIIQLITPPDWFGIRFSTYKPNDMLEAATKVGPTASMTLTPTFDGKPDPDAYVQIQADTISLPSADPAGTTMKAMLTGRTLKDLKLSPDTSYRWAAAATSFHFSDAGKNLAGTLIVGRRRDHTYRILAQYPVARGAEVAKRLQTLLEQWRWDDDFSYLVPAPPAPPADAAKAPAQTPAGKTVAPKPRTPKTTS